MTGFSDALYKEITATFKEIALDGKPCHYNVTDSLRPDFWFEPKEVWEIKGADLTLSPVHSAAAGTVVAGSERGVSLRFPRYIRKRLDKGVKDATTSMMVREMYRAQFADGSHGAGAGKAVADEAEMILF
jgi:DNA ligase-1